MGGVKSDHTIDNQSPKNVLSDGFREDLPDGPALVSLPVSKNIIQGVKTDQEQGGCIEIFVHIQPPGSEQDKRDSEG